MPPTREQLIANKMPGSEEDLSLLLVAAARAKVPVPTSGMFRATLVSREGPRTMQIASALDNFHSKADSALVAKIESLRQVGGLAEDYLNASPPGPHRVAVVNLEASIRKAYKWFTESLKNFRRYQADVVKLGLELERRERVRSNWAKAGTALSASQTEALRVHRALTNMDYLITNVEKITGIGGGTTAEMPKNAEGRRGVLNLYNPDMELAAPTGHGNYWLELIDPKHRSWGHQIGDLYTKWFNCETHLNFFDWLKQTNQGENLPSVAYLDPSQRWRYTVTFDGGVLKYPVDNGDIVTFGTPRFKTAFTGIGFAIWVADSKGTFYAGNHQVNEFHHSSFMAGGAVFGAGEWAVANGKIIFMTHKTGHYRTPTYRFLDIVRILSRVTDVRETVFELLNTQGRFRYCRGKHILQAAGSVADNKLISASDFAAAYDALRRGGVLTSVPLIQVQGKPVDDREPILKIIRAGLALDTGALAPPSQPPPIVV